MIEELSAYGVAPQCKWRLLCFFPTPLLGSCSLSWSPGEVVPNWSKRGEMAAHGVLPGTPQERGLK